MLRYICNRRIDKTITHIIRWKSNIDDEEIIEWTNYLIKSLNELKTTRNKKDFDTILRALKYTIIDCAPSYRDKYTKSLFQIFNPNIF